MIINDEILNDLSEEARDNFRLRKNFNLHKSESDDVQRLLNALEPGTIMPSHRHMHTEETYILLRGEMKVFFYNNEKQLINTFLLNPLKGEYGIHIPTGQWHSLEVIESGTVIFEVKKGPYSSLKESDIMKL
jgi:cupin fold WbuC family metalloprotein